jgi:hypothetical protein
MLIHHYLHCNAVRLPKQLGQEGSFILEFQASQWGHQFKFSTTPILITYSSFISSITSVPNGTYRHVISYAYSQAYSAKGITQHSSICALKITYIRKEMWLHIKTK